MIGGLSLSCLRDNFHASLNTCSASFSRRQIMMSLRRGEKEVKYREDHVIVLRNGGEK
jgi:hypothetical protein